jgi:hypothetical protein
VGDQLDLGLDLPPPLPPPPEPDSYDRRLTRRRRALLADGIHPTTRMPLLAVDIGSPRCGDCRHCCANQRSKVYWKCGTVPLTFGPSSDVRKSWPACTRFEPMRR